MNASDRADWLIPAGLVTLSAIPTVAGVVRVAQLAAGMEVTPDDARYLAAPVPVVLHIVGSLIFCLLGALQFSARLRTHRSGWHRGAGRVLIWLGLIAALSGVWMSHFNAPPIDSPGRFDGPAVYALRVLAGSAMAMALCLGFAAIRQRDIPKHRAWMLRGYALALGAGTQVVTHLPWYLLPSIQGELARTLFMAAGWGINLAVAEWSISRGRGAAAISGRVDKTAVRRCYPTSSQAPTGM